MPNTWIKQLALPLKAFTLLESLLVLFLTSFLLITFSNSFSTIFTRVQEQLFFLEFEHLYKDSQQLAASQHSPVTLTIDGQSLSNGNQVISLPASISTPDTYRIIFDEKGGNSSLAKLTFHTSHQTRHYQLYIGSGRYKIHQE